LPSEPRPNLLNSDEFSVLTHKDHPNHKISLKAHDPSDAVCNGATKGFSGYLSIGDWKHFYFYYFESRKAPATDPLIMWINGGPGCSSMTGLFMELGPCRVNEAGNSTDPNPASWIEEASVFFLDQPIGVGFSYADKGHGIEANGTFAAAEDVYVAVFLPFILSPIS
jgi:carboxypeptidase C (cathepsin A)